MMVSIYLIITGWAMAFVAGYRFAKIMPGIEMLFLFSPMLLVSGAFAYHKAFKD